MKWPNTSSARPSFTSERVPNGKNCRQHKGQQKLAPTQQPNTVTYIFFVVKVRSSGYPSKFIFHNFFHKYVFHIPNNAHLIKYCTSYAHPSSVVEIVLLKLQKIENIFTQNTDTRHFANEKYKSKYKYTHKIS